jgi:CBS-domain-containing membrane protein
VLTARAIMRPVERAPVAAHPVTTATKLDDLIPLLAETELALPVFDEQQKLVGCVDRTAVMLALSPNGTTGVTAQSPTAIPVGETAT